VEITEKYRTIADKVFERYRHHNPPQSALIPLLQDIQSELGFIPETAIERVSQLLNLSTSHVYGVTTFYHQFRLNPKGKHLVTVCQGTACHVKGSFKINEFLVKELSINSQTDTSKDGFFTLQQVRCVGACSLAPVFKIDDNFYGNADPSKVRQILSKYRKES
jgi:NADH:ubiquinone oxidoreductase subunit E